MQSKKRQSKCLSQSSGPDDVTDCVSRERSDDVAREDVSQKDEKSNNQGKRRHENDTRSAPCDNQKLKRKKDSRGGEYDFFIDLNAPNVMCKTPTDKTAKNLFVALAETFGTVDNKDSSHYYRIVRRDLEDPVIDNFVEKEVTSLLQPICDEESVVIVFYDKNGKKSVIEPAKGLPKSGGRGVIVYSASYEMFCSTA